MSYSVSESWETYNKLKKHLACGSSTNSKIPVFENVEPALIVRGKGCRVWDVDSNEYIDYRNALGPVSLGYAVEEIDSAVIEQLQNGIIFGHPHPLEGEVAGLLSEMIPCAEKIRFIKTGGEAIAATIKIARNATNRNKILHCGYNGWLNNLSPPRGSQPAGVAMAHPEKGVPPAISALHTSLPWGKLEEWENVFSQEGEDIAAAVVACNYAEMERGDEFLHAVRELTARHGSLFIMDEIVTGFRIAVGGAHEYFGIMPDMAVFGKGMANGMPIAAYMGRAGLLDSASDISITSTFGGETLSLAAAKAVIRFYLEKNVIEHFWNIGELLWKNAADLAAQHNIPVEIKGFPVCPAITFHDRDIHGAFFKAAYRNGVSLNNVSFVNFSHREKDIEETLERLERAFKEMA